MKVMRPALGDPTPTNLARVPKGRALTKKLGGKKLRKYVVEVRRWVKQARLGSESEEYEMTIEEVRELVKCLILQGVERADIRVKVAWTKNSGEARSRA